MENAVSKDSPLRDTGLPPGLTAMTLQLHGKRAFADVIKVNLISQLSLKSGDYLGFPARCAVIGMGLYKQSFLPAGGRREIREVWRVRRTQHTITGFESGKKHMQGLESHSQAKKQELQSYSL